MSTIAIEPAPAPTQEVRALVEELERELAADYRPEQRHGLPLEAIFQPHIRFFLARLHGEAVGCGGVALLPGLAEVKRMYVRGLARGQGVAAALLDRIESEARDAGYRLLRLETGALSVAAIRFYERSGFRRCEAFGAYASMPAEAIATSVFFEKRLDAPPCAVLTPAAADERATLENLVQLYAYDWSEMLPLAVGDDGRFAGLDLAPYWVDVWRHPLLLRVDDELAGFALVDGRSKRTGGSGVFDMAEFFVLRRFRRQGVGRAAAFAAFDRFQGRWEVRQREENAAATAFWRRVIGEYTRGVYEEEPWARPQWTERVQIFTTE